MRERMEETDLAKLAPELPNWAGKPDSGEAYAVCSDSVATLASHSDYFAVQSEAVVAVAAGAATPDVEEEAVLH